MADSTIDKVMTSPAAPAPAAGAPSRPQPSPAKGPAVPVNPDAQRDRVETRPPRLDPCWPPPMHPMLLGNTRFRPICIH